MINVHFMSIEKNFEEVDLVNYNNKQGLLKMLAYIWCMRKKCIVVRLLFSHVSNGVVRFQMSQ